MKEVNDVRSSATTAGRPGFRSEPRGLGPVAARTAFSGSRNAPTTVKEETRVSDDRTPELSAEELEQQAAQELPDREAMSLVNANIAAPINAAVALNVLSDGSTAYANAQQTAPITQST